MSYRIWFVFCSPVAVLAGLAFLVVPSIMIKQFGMDDYASTRLVTQFFGTVMLALGLLLWFAKDIADEGSQKGMGIALLFAAVAGLVVTLMGTFEGALRSNGWLAMVIYVVAGLGFAYLVFLRPAVKQ